MPNQLQGQPEVVQPLKHAHTQGLCLEQMNRCTNKGISTMQEVM